MPDVVVTVPKWFWTTWLGEGDAAGEPHDGVSTYYFGIPTRPKIVPGEWVYIVAHDRVRGRARLVALTDVRPPELDLRAPWYLVRMGGAQAVTIPERIRGFQGWRYRFWDRSIEQPFPDWRTP